VLWYRAQVVALFVGFGLLTAIAAPVIIIVAPCLLGVARINRRRKRQRQSTRHSSFSYYSTASVSGDVHGRADAVAAAGVVGERDGDGAEKGGVGSSLL
jgi:hypothetical protein